MAFFVFVLSLSVLSLFLVRHLRKLSDPLRDIPGPLLARWSPLWLAYYARRGKRFRAVHDAHQRYGNYVRICPGHVSIADPDAIPIVYGFGAGALPKSQYYDAFVTGTPSLFTLRNNAAHAQKRRLMSHAFSARSVLSFAPIIRGMTEAFVRKLDTMCKTDKPIDIMQWLNYLTFDIISDLTFGEPLGMLEKGSDVIEIKTPNGTIHCEQAIRLIEHRERLAAVLGIMPILGPIFRFLPDPFFARGRTSAYGLSLMAQRGVRTRLAMGSQRTDILNALIAARQADGQGQAQEQELVAEAVTILIAAHTGANSMAAILHLVRSHKHVYTALMAELDEHVGESEFPTYEQVCHLPYLQATITEGLRLHATNAIGVPRSAPPGGVVFGGILFPEGTELSVPAWTIQHDPALWGDPHVFRPERWLQQTDMPRLRRYMLIFGAGPRGCLGKHIANMEMLVVLATLFLRYDITLESQELPTFEGFQHQPVCVMVSLTPRKIQTPALMINH